MIKRSTHLFVGKLDSQAPTVCWGSSKTPVNYSTNLGNSSGGVFQPPLPLPLPFPKPLPLLKDFSETGWLDSEVGVSLPLCRPGEKEFLLSWDLRRSRFRPLGVSCLGPEFFCSSAIFGDSALVSRTYRGESRVGVLKRSRAG